jgi:hypothetical protein
MNEPLDAVFEHRDVEVDEEADWRLTEPQIGQELGVVNGQELTYGFDFDDKSARKIEIHYQRLFERHPFID